MFNTLNIEVFDEDYLGDRGDRNTYPHVVDCQLEKQRTEGGGGPDRWDPVNHLSSRIQHLDGKINKKCLMFI